MDLENRKKERLCIIKVFFLSKNVKRKKPETARKNRFF